MVKTKTQMDHFYKKVAPARKAQCIAVNISRINSNIDAKIEILEVKRKRMLEEIHIKYAK